MVCTEEGFTMIEIKNYNGTVIHTVDADSLIRADLRSADLRSANLSGADLRSADLSGANLRSANLSGADLYGASLSGANLSGADLRSADLRSADLRSANLSGADLSGADLRSADLRSADLRSANLSGADLSGANLRSANLSGADLRSADLSGANLSGADLSGADLRSADLSGANLSGADLRSADLRSANLSGADLRSADLSGANLRSANLSGADLRSADLSGANLRSANLSGADLYGASLSGANGYNPLMRWVRALIKKEDQAGHGKVQALKTIRALFDSARDSGDEPELGYCRRYRCNTPTVKGPLDSHYNSCITCSYCRSHCRCYECGACGTRVNPANTDQCPRCEYCHDCCECPSCDNCGARGNVCNGCSRGTNCCGCQCDEESRNIDLVDSPLTFHTAKLHERKINPSKRYIAAEIEVADGGDERTSYTVKKWKGCIVEDGSLPETGFEINTAPASGDRFVDQVSEICAALKEGRASVDSSCGLHVHIDARDFDYYTVRRLVKVYARIEDALFAMCSPSRRESTYCQPCGAKYLNAMSRGALPSYKALKKATFESIYDSKLHNVNEVKDKYSRDDRVRINRRQLERKKNKYDGARYSALNLHSWFYRGTIECRMFNGTINRDKIVSWGMLWACILDYAAQHTEKEIDKELLFTGARDMLMKVVKWSPASDQLVKFINDRYAKFGGE
jgi:uncharacterized protein YjbI with pentapeptide repeats